MLCDDDLASASQYAKVVRAETTDELTAHLGGEVPGQEVWKYLVIAAVMALVGEIALTRWVAMQRRAHKAEPIQFGSGAADVKTASAMGAPGRRLGSIIRYILFGIVAAGILLTAFHHPYIARRLVIMVPTLLIISVIVFVIIQLPPGDFLSTRVMELQESGDILDISLEDLKALFRYEDPVWKRYLRWMGIYWFATFDAKDAGLLQGNMGRSMESTREVNEMVLLPLTVVSLHLTS